MTHPGSPISPARVEKPAKMGCVVAFLMIFILVGVAMAGYFTYENLKAALFFKEIPCRIISSDVAGSESHRPHIVYEYEFNGTTHRSDRYSPVKFSASRKWAKKISRSYRPGSTQTCFVNPNEPTEAVLVTAEFWSFGFPLIFGFFFAGIPGFILFAMVRGKNMSREASESRGPGFKVAARRGMGSSLIGAGMELEKNLPLPKLKFHQGSQLPVRLSVAVTRLGSLIGTLIFALFWNGIVSIFVYQVVQSWLKGRGGVFEIFLTLFLIPFVLVGLFAIGLFFYTLFKVRTKDVVMEISKEPLRGGESFRVYFHQPGPVRFTRLQVRLICEEVVQYTRGTDTFTDRAIARELLLLEEKDPTAATHHEISKTLEAAIPQDAMHSFKSKSNELLWKLRFSMAIPGRPDVEHDFAFRVLPSPPSFVPVHAETNIPA
jgi:hypothetical protein